MPDGHLISPLEDLLLGGRFGVNLRKSASCLSGPGLPAWSQLAAFAVHAAENYHPQEQAASSES